MKLTHWTDYSLRVLMYCAMHAGRRPCPTIAEVARVHGISRSHLTKVVMTLAHAGWLETTRGRGGGMRLTKPAAQISVGQIVRQTETDFHLVECFNAATSRCRMDGYCQLKHLIGQALDNYLAVLDGVTLADLIDDQADGIGISAAR